MAESLLGTCEPDRKVAVRALAAQNAVCDCRLWKEQLKVSSGVAYDNPEGWPKIGIAYLKESLAKNFPGRASDLQFHLDGGIVGYLESLCGHGTNQQTRRGPSFAIDVRRLSPPFQPSSRH